MPTQEHPTRSSGRDTWDARQRRTARLVAFIIGIVLELVGACGGMAIAMIAVLKNQDVSLVAVAFSGILVVVGVVFLMPNVGVPLAYRIIDKVAKDTTGPEYREEGE
jgi:hypothetical protein